MPTGVNLDRQIRDLVFSTVEVIEAGIKIASMIASVSHVHSVLDDNEGGRPIVAR